jgi:hypothetical protein
MGNPRKHSITGIPVNLNVNEAPEGYTAIAKCMITSNENVCHFCDCRKECNVIFSPCMSYSREDKISVFFKKK